MAEKTWDICLAMKKRLLGNTGLQVSEIGFGGWQLGNVRDWGGMDDGTAHRLIHAAVDWGINLFDTAPNYAGTHSERLLGEALTGRRGEVVLVSKFGHPPEGPKDFSVNHFWTSLEGSLRRLRTDYVDVLLLHNPEASMYEGSDPLWTALDQAVQQGKVRHYGASLDFASEIEACLDNTRSSVLEILFNILHQDARKAFAKVETGAGAIVKVPLDSGWLTGRFNAESRFQDIRARWTPEQTARRASYVDEISWLVEDGSSLTSKALAFVLSYRAVSCVIPGIRTMAQLEQNAQASGTTLSHHELRRLEAFWEEITAGGTDLLPW